ncbi:MAG TPA: hypothetical protein VEB18_00935 [Candidatus Paceibacterota bacterium]|nr:hypothetical protein [Candidatus Paceibacterota bacterium]
MAETPSGGGGTDLMFFVGMMLLFFLVWIAGGGPSRPISLSGPLLTPIAIPGPGGVTYGTTTPGGSGISAGATVSITKDSTGAKSTDAKTEYLTIYVSPVADGPISTAGWRLVSRQTGESAAFPLGAEIPRSGSVNTLTPITLQPGDQAIIVSGRSPVGVSFKENLCTGYLEERQDFKPPLAQSCPTPYQEFQRYAEDESEKCAEYVRSIPYCATETNTSQSVGSSCRDFVDEYLNYNGCVRAHQNDSNFKGTTWRIYLGSGDDLWRSEREKIELIDASGNVLDSLSY